MQRLLQPGDEVEGRWRVEQWLGAGQFSEVYQVADADGQQYALKIERDGSARTCKQEHAVLHRLQGGTSGSLVRVHTAGRSSQRGSGPRFFFVMDLLGKNLAETRREDMPGGRADPCTAKIIATRMLRALEDVHSAGFVHRDVKPANFVAGSRSVTPREAQWCLIDFGLARQFVDDGGAPLAQRAAADFRGSTTYSSVNVQQRQDQGRRDDLWGWLYTVVELLDGTLPWRRETGLPGGLALAGSAGSGEGFPPLDGSAAGGTPPSALARAGSGTAAERKAAVLQRKLECVRQPQLLFSAMPCPKAIYDLSRYLAELRFEAAVDYAYVRARVNELDSGEEAPPLGTAPPSAPATAPPTTGLRPGSSSGEEAARGAVVGPREPSRPASPLALPLEQRPPGLGPGEVARAGPMPSAPAAGKELQPAALGEQDQLGDGPLAMSKQRSWDRSRDKSRRGRERRSRSRSRDRRSSSRDRNRRSCSRDRNRRSRSRDRDRRSRSRDRDRRSRSREHSARSRSRDRHVSRRSRSRECSRSRQRERERPRRRRSRSRSHERFGKRRRGSSRSRSRSPRGGRQQHRREGSGAQELSQAGSLAATAGAEPAGAGLGAGGTLLARAAGEGAQARAAPTEVDTHQRYRGMLDLTFALRQGALSESAAAACAQLRALEASDAVWVLCWLLDELATATEPRHLPAVAAFCGEIAAFASGTAKRCLERAQQQQQQ